MPIELVPVIEIVCNHQDLQAPKVPYWNNEDKWTEFRNECYKKAGFKDMLVSYAAGSPFYGLDEISRSNLVKITIDHTRDSKDQSCSFFGGYVLCNDNRDMLFPQCCGLLADINFWTKIATGEQSYYEGHPAPEISFHEKLIVFDLVTGLNSESFEPPPPISIFSVNKSELWQAVERAKEKLLVFAERLKQINVEENLQIGNIDDVLIWRDDNY